MKKFTVFFILLLSLGHSASAQTAPRMFLSWEANTLAPAGFEGRRLPTANSLVNVSVGVVSAGRLLDLSGQNVYWYVNDSFHRGGPGLDRISVLAPEIRNTVIEVRAELPDSPEGLLATTRIPVVSPKVVIQSNRPAGQFRQSPLVLKGEAFYFNLPNASSLSFGWRANGVSPKNTENPSTLVINLPADARPGYAIEVSLLGRNPNQLLEMASRKASFFFNP